MAPKSKRSRAGSSSSCTATFSKISKRTVSASLKPSSTVTGVEDDDLFDTGRRKLRRRDSDDRVDRVLVKKLKPHFDDAAIEGPPFQIHDSSRFHCCVTCPFSYF